MKNTDKPPAPELDPDAQDSYEGRLNQALFQAAVSSISSNLAHTPGLQELAAELRTNSKRLNSAFRACSGKTVFEYLREMRMAEARRLLVESLLDIGEIAQSVGFRTPANFSTAFREQFGMSPRQYRATAGSHDSAATD